MSTLLLDKTFQTGLRAKAQANKGMPLLVDCLNAVPTPDGTVPAFTGLEALPTDLLTTIFATIGASRAFPSPQILRGRALTFLGLPTALYTISEADWSGTALQPISTTPTNLLTNGGLETSDSGWTAGVSWEWQFDPEQEPAFGGHLRHLSGSTAASQPGVLQVGHTYFVSLQARSDLSNSTLTVRMGTNTLVFNLTDEPRSFSGYLEADGIDFEILNSLGSNPLFTQVEVYEVQPIPTGGLWQLADFGPVYVLVNGACTIFTCLYSQGGFTQSRCFIDTALNPNTVLNYRGRLTLGGPQGTDTWAALWDTFWAAVASSTGTTGMPTENLSDRHFWWSSIGGEDMLQYFLPETLLEQPGTTSLAQARNILANSDFRRRAAGWVLSSGLSADDLYLQHTVGTVDTAEQTLEDMALPPVLGDTYEIRLRTANRISGSISVYLGTALVLTTTSHTFYTGRGAFTGDTTLRLEFSSGFDGSLVSITCRPVADQGVAEDIWLLGEQGQRALPWQGAVLSQQLLGGHVLVGTKDGLGAFSPAGSTLGFTHVHNVGLAGRGALGGSLREALFVDRTGTIWRIGSDLSLTREGREEYLAPLLDETGPVVHYNEDRDEYVIAFAESSTFVVSRTGVGQLATSIYALPYLEGQYRYLADPEAEDLTVTLETDTIDFGSRGVTNLRELEACFDGTDLALTLLNRMGTGDDWREIGPFTFQEAGRLIRTFSQTELKVRLTFPTLDSFQRFSYLRLQFDEGGRGAFADTLNLSNLL